jgi:putative ABC transport system permease protein
MHFLTFVLKNLLRRRARTALTVLGLAVAVGSMIALLGVSDSFRAAQADTFEKRGVDLVVIQAGATNQLASEVDEAAVDRVRALPAVEAVDAALVDLTEMQTRDPRGPDDTPPSMNVLVQAWLPENFGYDDMEVISGRKLTAADAGKWRCMLGTKLADKLGKGAGGAVTVNGQRFEVVGVFRSFNVYENGAVITLLRDYQDFARRKGKVTGFSLRVRKTSANPDDDVEAVRREINALTGPDGRSLRLEAERPKEYLDKASHLRLIQGMAWVVSLVAVVIGVISMVNTMAMSVLERTQEIGILRAVGWPRRRVIGMVLGEAVLLGLAAAAVGAAGAVAATHLLALSPKTDGFIEGGIAWAVILQGFAVTVGIGLLGGAYPAYRAARLLPTEAIRHD